MTKEEYKKYYDSIYDWFMKCPIDYEQFTEFPTGEVLADGWRFNEMIKDITVALKLHKRFIGDYSYEDN